MPANADLLAFVRGSFSSVWSMELFLLLKSDPERAWSGEELVSALRASESVVAQSIQSLVAAGLIVLEADNSVRYGPASSDIEALANEAEHFYRKRPDAVRRVIITAAHDQLRAFSDAFRLRKD